MVIALGKSRWELPLPKKHLTEKFTLDKQAKHWTQEEICQVLCLEHCFIWLRDLDTNKIGAEVFAELWNVVLEENEEDQMVRESTNEQVLDRIGEKRTTYK